MLAEKLARVLEKTPANGCVRMLAEVRQRFCKPSVTRSIRVAGSLLKGNNQTFPGRFRRMILMYDIDFAGQGISGYGINGA